MVIGVIVLICKSVRAKRNKAVQVKEENIEKIEEVVSEVAVCDAQEEVLTDNSDSKKRIPFANKMLELDEKTQEYYNVIMNKFKS